MVGLRPAIERQMIFRFPREVQTGHIPELDLVSVDSENVESVLDFRDQFVAHKFRQFLNAGKVGIYAVLSGSVVGHAWLSIRRGQPSTVSGYFPLELNQGLVHHCNVSEDVRGQGIYAAMVGELITPFIGKIDVLIDSARDNDASLRAIKRMGCEALGSGIYIHFGSHLITYREKVLSNAQGWR